MDSEARAPARREAARRDTGKEVLIALLLLASIGATVGLGIVYALGGQVQAEGVLLGVSMGGIALALGLWARHFMPSEEFSEERPDLTSSPEERQAFAEDFEQGESTVTRRRLLFALLTGSLGALGAVALFPIRSLGPRPVPAFRRTSWRPGVRLVDGDGVPVRTDTLETNGVLTVFPEGVEDVVARAQSQTLLIRTEPGVLRPGPQDEGSTPEGYVAFSKVCTHAGCPVGLYEAETHQLVCPCHQSLFDVTDGAKPVFGPATRSLPQLPLEIDADGYLVARGDFPEPVGPGFWSFGR